MNSITIASLNVQSVRKMPLFKELYSHMKATDTAVLLIQEAFINAELEEEIRNDNPGIDLTSNRGPQDKRGAGGVAIIINKALAEWEQTVGSGPSEVYKDQAGRLIATNIRTGGRLIRAASMYVLANDQEKVLWMERTIVSARDQHLVGHCDIIGTDMNIKTSTLDYKRGERSPSSYVVALQDTVRALGGEHLMIDGWRHRNMKTRTWSWGVRNEEKVWIGFSRLDAIFVREDWLQDTKVWDIGPSGLETDHKKVSMVLKASEKPPEMRKRFRLQLSILQDDELMETLLRHLNDVNLDQGHWQDI